MNSLSHEIVSSIVIFHIEQQTYALYLNNILKVVRSVEITPLPKAPEIVVGIIDFHGEIIPVINIRKLFNLPVRKIMLEDQFIIAKTSYRTIALIVDSVEEISGVSDHETTDTKELLPFADYLSGIVKIKNDIILINDLEKLLSLSEQDSIDNALKKLRNETGTVK